MKETLAAPGPIALQVETLRGFNRFYTHRIGVLEEGLLDTRFTLAQARVLFELGMRRSSTAGAIGEALGLDPGYLSRILQDFSRQRLIARTKSESDRRRVLLSLTASGRKEFLSLDRRSRADVSSMLSALHRSERSRLLSALSEVQRILSAEANTARDELVVRAHRIGDVGWAIERHAQLYAEEFQWNEEFEALVAGLFARFASDHDSSKERFWVAELGGERVGCVFVVRNDEDPSVAQLRCLLVDPRGRGCGVGRRLVAECIEFARKAGYRRMILWTNDVLVSARRIYEAAGFSLVQEERHHSFGHDLVGQVWGLDLKSPRPSADPSETSAT
jgi:DNA-binding MarR family transcriptional regulator/GNAT superfamily N-acetyltransferase